MSLVQWPDDCCRGDQSPLLFEQRAFNYLRSVVVPKAKAVWKK